MGQKNWKRQIIIVTHNPNIPVLGDSEGILILDRDSFGKVTFRKNKKAGCIEEQVIKEGICEIMEGGEAAFKKKRRKISKPFGLIISTIYFIEVLLKYFA